MDCRLPPRWFFTDERVGDPGAVVDHLPEAVGVIVRHRDPAARVRLGAVLRACCRPAGRVLLVAGTPEMAAAAGADGVHLPSAIARSLPRYRLAGAGVVTVACHGPVDLRAAGRLGADAVFVSPVFATASHPAGRPLGVHRFAGLARRAGRPVFALGGVDQTTFRRVRPISSVAGYGGIAVFAPGQ